MNLFTKQKQTHRLQKQTYGNQRGNVGWGRDKSGVWDEHIHTTLYKIENQHKDLLYSTGTLLNIL